MGSLSVVLGNSIIIIIMAIIILLYCTCIYMCITGILATVVSSMYGNKCSHGCSALSVYLCVTSLSLACELSELLSLLTF